MVSEVFMKLSRCLETNRCCRTCGSTGTQFGRQNRRASDGRLETERASGGGRSFFACVSLFLLFFFSRGVLLCLLLVFFGGGGGGAGVGGCFFVLFFFFGGGGCCVFFGLGGKPVFAFGGRAWNRDSLEIDFVT